VVIVLADVLEQIQAVVPAHIETTRPGNPSD
jgi:hypothetical protein